MKTVAKVFRTGNSRAVRLPDNWDTKAEELVVELQPDGELLLYDPAERDRAFERRLAALRVFSEHPDLGVDFGRP